jgi:methionine-rich copper-binding protein CopC
VNQRPQQQQQQQQQQQMLILMKPALWSDGFIVVWYSVTNNGLQSINPFISKVM